MVGLSLDSCFRLVEVEVDFEADDDRYRLASFLVQMAGLKRYCFTASTAFSSRPMPKDRATCTFCGLPCASTIREMVTMPSYLARRASSENSASTE